jgi:hypothetical protein
MILSTVFKRPVHNAVHFKSKHKPLFRVCTILISVHLFNTLRTGHLNCLNPRSRALNTVIQLLYFVSLKIHNKFADDYLRMRSRSYKHPSAVPFGDRLHVLRN